MDSPPPVLVFMIYASLAWILIIIILLLFYNYVVSIDFWQYKVEVEVIWKPYRSNIILLTNYRIRSWWFACGQVNTIDGPTKLARQDAILGGLSIGHLLAWLKTQVSWFHCLCLLLFSSSLKGGKISSKLI